jgi:hypothetical protein
MTDNATEFGLEAVNGRFNSRSSAWADQVADLQESIRALPGVQIQMKTRPTSDVKGPVFELILTAMPTALPALTAAFKAWLSRDRDRRLRLTVTRGGVPTTLEIDAQSVSDETIRSVASAALDG